MAVTMATTDTGEERRETGRGIIQKIEGAGRNRQVTIKATHTDLRKPVTGWLDSTNERMLTFAQEAQANRVEVDYLVVVHRKGKVSPSIPFANLESDDKVRDLVELAPVGASSSEEVHAAAPPQDQPATAPQAAQERPAGPAAANGTSKSEAFMCRFPGCDAFGFSNEGDRDGHETMAHARVTPEQAAAGQAAGTTPAADEAAPTEDEPAGDPTEPPHPADEPGTTTRPTPPPAPSRRAKVEEARAWEPYNSDGKLNLGSYAVTASVGFAELAFKLVVDNMTVEATREGRGMESLDMARVGRLTRTLLRLADRTQASLRADGRVNRMDASHTRARGAVRLIIESYPPPFGLDAEEQKAWGDLIVAQASEVLAIGIALVDPDEDLR